MKKILLSAAILVASITGAMAQCDGTATPNGMYMDFTKIVEYANFGEPNMEIMVIHPDAEPANGYVDSTSTDYVVTLKPSVTYGIGSYGSKVDFNSNGSLDWNERHYHHAKAFIDFDGDGDFSGAEEEVFATDITLHYIDGKNIDYSTYSEGFTLASDATAGTYKMRIVSMANTAQSTGDDDLNTITACGPYTNGSVVDINIEIVDPATVGVYVVNEAGVLVTDNMKTFEITGNDIAGTSAISSVQIINTQTLGTAVVEGLNIVYTAGSVEGAETITYTVTDVNGNVSNEGTLTIDIVQFEGLVKIIEDVESGKGLFDRDVAGSGQSMGIEQTQTEVSTDVFLNGAQSLKATYQDGSSATIPGDFAWYDRFAVNHWAGQEVAEITEIADHDNLYLSVSIHTTTASYGAKASFLVKATDGTSTFYIQSEPVLLGNHDTNWNLIQADINTPTDWGEWAPPAADGPGNPILGGYVDQVITQAWINAIIIEGTNDSPDMILNLDNLMVTNIALTAPEVDVPTENLSNEKLDLAQVSAYPNPVKNTLNLDLSKQVSSVTVYSAIGSVVYTNEAPSKNLVIDTQAWNAGMYFVSVKEGNSTQTIKVIK